MTNGAGNDLERATYLARRKVCEWGISENSRRARFYSITRTGRKQLTAETELWSRTVAMMNRLLDDTQTPFGTVVRPLDFHRETLEATALSGPEAILRIRAVLLTKENLPFSLVIENYSPALLGQSR